MAKQDNEFNYDDLGIPPDPAIDQALEAVKMFCVLVVTYYSGLVKSGIEEGLAHDLTMEFNRILASHIVGRMQK